MDNKSQRQLFGFTLPNELREINQKKSRALIDKTSDLKTAINKHVKNGNYIGIGGFGLDRIPSAALHEIVRQRKKNLTLGGHTATHDGQILCAGDCVSKIDAAYVVGVELLGLSPHYRRVIQNGTIEITEWTNATLAWRYKAAAMGLSFLPVRSMLGTDTFKFSRAIEFTCPFTNEKYALVPACSPDVAIIHVHRADIYGNCQIDGISVSDYDLVRASKKVIITCEEIISIEKIRAHSERTIIPYYLVDAVVHIPYGSYPGNMPEKYYLDVEHLKEWSTNERDEELFKKFLDKYIYGVNSWKEYLELCGGEKRLEKLKNIEINPKILSAKNENTSGEKAYNMTEFMICTASKFLEDNKSAVVGTGLPMLASMLAQKTHAPNLLTMFEAGGVGPILPALPLSVGDSRTHYKAILATSMPDIMETCAKGYVDYAFLGGAQIDKYGNLNSTLIGDNYEKPKVRLPGSGGANDLASLCFKTIIIMKMDKHKFVETLDFLTTPGYLTGQNAREQAGLPPNGGPYKVITDCCVLGFDSKTKEMYLESIHPCFTPENIQNRCSFDLKIRGRKIPLTTEPTQKELEILRNEIDPTRQVLNK